MRLCVVCQERATGGDPVRCADLCVDLCVRCDGALDFKNKSYVIEASARRARQAERKRWRRKIETLLEKIYTENPEGLDDPGEPPLSEIVRDLKELKDA